MSNEGVDRMLPKPEIIAVNFGSDEYEETNPGETTKGTIEQSKTPGYPTPKGKTPKPTKSALMKPALRRSGTPHPMLHDSHVVSKGKGKDILTLESTHAVDDRSLAAPPVKSKMAVRPAVNMVTNAASPMDNFVRQGTGNVSSPSEEELDTSCGFL